MLPDLPVADYEQVTETTAHERKEHIRRVSIEAITQATAVAKANRAMRAKPTPSGQFVYREGELVDYHRTPTTKDDWGGWSGPYPVIKNEPSQGQLVILSLIHI